MDWKTAGKTIPEITTRDLVVFRLPQQHDMAAQNGALADLQQIGQDPTRGERIARTFESDGLPELCAGFDFSVFAEQFNSSLEGTDPAHCAEL